jgi:hypothetical protein
MRKLHVLIGIGIITTALIASTAMAATGIVRNLSPPGNTGDAHGAGQIEEIVDGVLQGRPYFVFQIPQVISGAVAEGDLVTFIRPSHGLQVLRLEGGRQGPSRAPRGAGR